MNQRMNTTRDTLSQEDKAALCQMQQKASNLHQSSSNKFLVALEGLMLAAIAWESIGKEKKWLSNLSKGTTAIGLAIAGAFTVTAIRDNLQAKKADDKLKQYGFDEFTLPCEQAPVHKPYVPHDRPHNKIHAHGAHAEKMQEREQQMAM